MIRKLAACILSLDFKAQVKSSVPESNSVNCLSEKSYTENAHLLHHHHEAHWIGRKKLWLRPDCSCGPQLRSSSGASSPPNGLSRERSQAQHIWQWHAYFIISFVFSPSQTTDCDEVSAYYPLQHDQSFWGRNHQHWIQSSESSDFEFREFRKIQTI